MEELTLSVVGAVPRCSTALEGSLDFEDEGDDAFFEQTSSNPLECLKETIESLKLDQRVTSQPIDTDSDYTSMVTDASVTNRSQVDRSIGLVELSGVSSLSSIIPEPPQEPEVEHIQKFRLFGVRFIRETSQYNTCDCKIPQQLLDWKNALSEVAKEKDLLQELPICFQFRWAEVKQDFQIDVFGDLQFQDFLLGREERGPYHAMIHFAGIFANVGFDGYMWYWVTEGDTEFPFVEEKFRNKQNFIDGLCTMVGQFSRTKKIRMCPEVMVSSLLFVREAYDEQCAPEESFDDDRVDLISENFYRSTELLDVDPKKKGPRSLSYLQLFSETYFDLLSTL